MRQEIPRDPFVAIHNLQHKEDEGHCDYLIQGGKVSKGFEFWFLKIENLEFC